MEISEEKANPINICNVDDSAGQKFIDGLIGFRITIHPIGFIQLTEDTPHEMAYAGKEYGILYTISDFKNMHAFMHRDCVAYLADCNILNFENNKLYIFWQRELNTSNWKPWFSYSLVSKK